jgi:hypothetical protein
MRSGSGCIIARAAHQQGLRCAMPKGYAQPLLHRAVTSLSGRNSVFSKLQEQTAARRPVRGWL